MSLNLSPEFPRASSFVGVRTVNAYHICVFWRSNFCIICHEWLCAFDSQFFSETEFEFIFFTNLLFIRNLERGFSLLTDPEACSLHIPGTFPKQKLPLPPCSFQHTHFNNPGRFDICSHEQWGEAWEFLSTKIIRSCKPISEDDKMVKKKYKKTNKTICDYSLRWSGLWTLNQNFLLNSQFLS